MADHGETSLCSPSSHSPHYLRLKVCNGEHTFCTCHVCSSFALYYGTKWTSLLLLSFTVDRYISDQLPVLLELRVRYLLTCERVREAMALAKCCSQHPTAGEHPFFLQVYLTWLHKTSQNDLLNKEVTVVYICAHCTCDV